jgi:hypothetical protein
MEASRFHLFALLILACISALNGEYISSVGEVSAAYARQCYDKRFFLLAALSNVHKMRVLGVIGYLFCALGRFDIGDVFLALHYGVIGIDDKDLPSLGRISSGAAGLSLVL